MVWESFFRRWYVIETFPMHDTFLYYNQFCFTHIQLLFSSLFYIAILITAECVVHIFITGLDRSQTYCRQRWRSTGRGMFSVVTIAFVYIEHRPIFTNLMYGTN